MKNDTRIVMIVCRGNIVRSPFAEAIINHELVLRGRGGAIRASSRGVQGTVVDPEPVKHSNITFYADLHRSASHVFEALGIDPSKHISERISHHDIKRATIIIAMDETIRQKLSQLFADSTKAIHLFSEVFGGVKDVIDPETAASSTAQILLKMRAQIVGNFDLLLQTLDSEA